MFFKTKSPNHPSEVLSTFSTVEELSQIVEKSFQSVVGIFKHSTRCSISSMSKSRVESAITEVSPEIYLLDLIAHRGVSDEISSRFGIRHESPQLILLQNGKVIYNESHAYINLNEAVKSIQQ